MYLALTTAGISLAKSIIDLIIAVIKARSEGINKGDRAKDPLELIVRRAKKDGEYKEEIIYRIGHKEAIKRKELDDAVKKGLDNIFKD